jgi:peroxiredoxin
MELNQPIPEFTLPDMQGRIHMLSDYQPRIVIINFWSAECPYSEKADLELVKYLPEWGDAVSLLTIASNDNEKPGQIAAVARRRKLPFILHDERHRVADRFGAVTTPHVFIADGSGFLRYQGAFDDVTFRRRESTRSFAKEAVDALLAGRLPDPVEMPAYGCTIVRFVLE